MRRYVVWAVPVVLVALLWVNQSLGEHNGTTSTTADAIWLLSFCAFALVGGLAVRGRSANPIGWLFLFAGLGTALASTVREWGRFANAGWAEPAALVLFGLAWLAATSYPLFFFPDGRLPSPRWRPVVVALSALAVGQSVAIVLGQWTVTTVCEFASLAFTALGIVSIVRRWRRSGGVVRQQLSWLAMGGLIIVALYAVEAWLVGTLGPNDTRGALIEAAVLLTIPAVTAVAILRHRMLDIELVLRRSIVYGLLTTIVLAAYAVSLTVAARFFDSSARAGASLVASALVAVALSPAKERLDRMVEWALFGDRRRPERPLAALGARLSVARADEAMAAAAESVRAALRLPYVRIELEDGSRAAVGAESDDLLQLELASHGVIEGRLLAARRSGGDDFSLPERALLGDLASQVALVARSIRLNNDLRRSRERLVHAREQERLRLRRDLHDGLGPVLAGLTLQVDALRPNVSADGVELLDRVKTELRRCMADVRRAVDGLRPADLDQFGLAGVVSEQARSLSASGVRVTVDCSAALDVGPAVEVAAYRIVTEAMTNVVRHAGARTCWVTITRTGSSLVVSVEDDGVGIDPSPPPGVGLPSMRERADELGGTFEFSRRSGGGSAVRALIPVEVLA